MSNLKNDVHFARLSPHHNELQTLVGPCRSARNRVCLSVAAFFSNLLVSLSVWYGWLWYKHKTIAVVATIGLGFSLVACLIMFVYFMFAAFTCLDCDWDEAEPVSTPDYSALPHIPSRGIKRV